MLTDKVYTTVLRWQKRKKTTTLIQNKKGPLRTPDYMHFCFLGSKFFEKDNLSPAPPKFYLIFLLYMYELYSVCASLLCETQKDETKQKRWQKHYREDKKQYVGGILITSFKLPVLSCSQLLKITGFKNTIYNVLALDRCSTCVTVLIYETKMVTVNYVFLCAFFFKKRGRRLSGHGSSWYSCPEKKKKKRFCFWWNIMETKHVSENGKKWKKMTKKKKWKKIEKIYEYIFFLKQYISVWLVIEHFLFLGNK